MTFPNVGMAASLGVVLFFILSGFLIGKVYLSSVFTGASVWRYVVARFARIFPLYSIVIVLGALLFDYGAAPGPFVFGSDEIVRHLLFIGAGQTVWTIGVEFRFYAVFIIIWGLYAFSPQNRDAYMASAIIASILVLWAMGLHGGRIDLQRYLHLFLLGVLASIALRRPPPNICEHLAGFLLPVLLILYGVAFFTLKNAYANMTVCILGFLIVVCAVTAPTSVAGKLLSSRPFVFMGEISFGIYLLHRVVFLGVDHLGISHQPGIVKLVIVFVATIFISWLAFIAIEKPSRRAIRQFGEAIPNRCRSRSIHAGE